MASRSTRKRGSKAFWPRVRAQKQTAVVNSWDPKGLQKEATFLGFPGYKVGMTSMGIIDNFSHTITKGQEISTAATVVECPAIKVMSMRLFGYDEYGNKQVVKEISVPLKDKFLDRKVDVQKKANELPKVEELIDFAHQNEVDEIRAKIVTAPSETGIGKKKPEILELGVSGSIDEAISYVYEKLGKEVRVGDVFKAGELADTHGITIGKGFQGTTKRFGTKLTSHKSEKSRRHAGNVGAWTPSRVLTTVPMAGQHGFHERTEWNKWILKISDNVEEINNAAGFKRYGVVKNDYLLIKGSIVGPKKRLITFAKAARPNKRYPSIAPEIVYINK